MNFLNSKQFPLSPKEEGLIEGYERGFVTCVGTTLDEMKEYAGEFYASKHEVFGIDEILAMRPDFIEGVVEGARISKEFQNFISPLFPRRPTERREGVAA